MSAIQLRSLTKIYKKSHLFKIYQNRGVEDINLEINEGEIFGLLGLNGSGKTTTIKLILGLLKPTMGRVSILGSSGPTLEALKNIGYLPEVPYFYRYLTAKEILKLYGRLSKIEDIDKKVDNILETVGLTGWKDKKLTEYSKGMVQRIGLAQSLLHDPKILIYDEPVSGLDPLALAEIRNLIFKLKEQGKTIFLSSHLISEVEKLCDRAGILVNGRLVKVLEQKEWSGASNKLEKIFVETVSGSVQFGKISS